MGASVNITFSFCGFLALALLLLPPQWSFAAVLAALIHECFHILVVILCGGQIYRIHAFGTGARIEASALGTGKQALCALAGPVGSFLCLLASEYYPELALCGLIQGAYNLFPIYPLDGANFLRCIVKAPVYKGAEWFALTIITGFSLWLGVFSLELAIPVLISGWYPVIQRKFSCKEGNLAVQ